MGASAERSCTPHLSVSCHRGSSCTQTPAMAPGTQSYYRQPGDTKAQAHNPGDTEEVEFQYLPATNHSPQIVFGCGHHTCLPGGRKGTGVSWPKTSPKSGAQRGSCLVHMCSLHPLVCICSADAKHKGSCKQNSLLLEARHRADVVGPEVVNDGSQAFDPLLKRKEKVFPVSKSTRAKPY